MMKKYSVREKMTSEADEKLKKYSPLVRLLLYGRGIENESDAEEFLNPDYDKHLHDPFLLKGMNKAVDRIISAIKNNEKIGIFSDYDADGIPGAVALHDFFKKIGFYNFVNYIPLRNEEGFGLNNSAISNLNDEGVRVLITIDCGITDVLQVDLANKYGIDVIITDHHTALENLPKAYAIINPKQRDCPYPFKMLCGAGVIFKLIQGVISKLKENDITVPSGWEKWLLDMVGLATLSDMVSLTGENRALSYYGMKVMRKSGRVGLRKLFSLLNIDQRNITEDDISFMITPRINAASRMGIPLDAFKLLSTDDEIEAGILSEHLNNKNDERKGVVGSMAREIKKKLASEKTNQKNVFVFGNPEWKPSLLGLVASSISEEEGKPVFFWGRNGEGEGLIKGSCRGGGFDVVKLMEKVRDILVDFGGHKEAGGFSILQENIHILEDRLNEAFLLLSKNKDEEKSRLVDAKLSLEDINWNTFSDIEKFGPFGFDNPKPIFLFESIEVLEMKLFGKEKNHLELKFKDSNKREISAIAFFQNGDKFSTKIEKGKFVNLLASIEKSVFRGFPELRLRVIEVY